IELALFCRLPRLASFCRFLPRWVCFAKPAARVRLTLLHKLCASGCLTVSRPLGGETVRQCLCVRPAVPAAPLPGSDTGERHPGVTLLKHLEKLPKWDSCRQRCAIA